MLFHVRMDVHIPLDMPADKANEIKAIEKLIRKNYNAKVNGAISGELQASTRTSAFLMSRAMKNCTTFYRVYLSIHTWTLK